jgi:hypothetical protein
MYSGISIKYAPELLVSDNTATLSCTVSGLDRKTACKKLFAGMKNRSS